MKAKNAAIILVASLALAALLGCVEQPVMTCDEYCESQPHVECIGTWQVSGTYPNCQCNFNCTVSEAKDYYNTEQKAFDALASELDGVQEPSAEELEAMLGQ